MSSQPQMSPKLALRMRMSLNECKRRFIAEPHGRRWIAKSIIEMKFCGDYAST